MKREDERGKHVAEHRVARGIRREDGVVEDVSAKSALGLLTASEEQKSALDDLAHGPAFLAIPAGGCVARAEKAEQGQRGDLARLAAIALPRAVNLLHFYQVRLFIGAGAVRDDHRERQQRRRENGRLHKEPRAHHFFSAITHFQPVPFPLTDSLYIRYASAGSTEYAPG
jgi:hypothetical protein